MLMIANLILRTVELTDAATLHKNCWPDLKLPDIQLRIAALSSTDAANHRGWGISAVINNEVVGFGQLMRWGMRGEICNLIVTEMLRSTGIGTALIQRLIGIARIESMRDVEIGAAQSNTRALALYRRLGFRDERRVTLDLGYGMEPVIYLVLPLGPGICEA